MCVDGNILCLASVIFFSKVDSDVITDNVIRENFLSINPPFHASNHTEAQV